MKVLIAYGSTDGMTARIATRMAQTLRHTGHVVDVVNTAAVPADLEPECFDAIMVGASLHAGGYQRLTRRFIRRNRQALRATTSGFFSVCMAIASKDQASRDAAWSIARALPAKLGWNPDVIEVIAGALMFSRYGFLRRMAMVRIARKELGDVDASRDHIYTDWEAVDWFVLGFVELAQRRAAVPPRQGAELRA